jgi:hypothetical protein
LLVKLKTIWVKPPEFSAISRLRSKFPGIRSVMMAVATLEKYRHLTGAGEKAGKPPGNLTAEEQKAYDVVARENLRLEQEKIPQLVLGGGGYAKEAGALELARVRTTSFWNAKMILTSTPTVEGGQIWQAYLNGTRHKYFVKCPHCQHEQELLWQQVKWPSDERTKSGEVWNVDAVEKLTYYECPACRNHIEQNWRHTMIRGGCWKATNPNAPADRVSFHLNALYSPWRTWGSIAREFLEVKDSFSGLQNFTNSVLAEPWKPIQGEIVSEAQLLDLRADQPRSVDPPAHQAR